MKFQRRALGPKDVAIRIHHCGACHSDIHTIRGDWGKIQYPQIVGHELAGEVVAVGSSVSKFNVGARVGVGTMVNSCRVCRECQAGHENYCLNGNTQTYGSKDRDGRITQGGYSTFVVVDEDFVINIPNPIDLAEAGPLLCAGITVYSPLHRWGVSPGKKVAIVGMGGLGHLAVTQEFINLCALNKIKPEVTKISMNGIDDAWKKVVDKQARYRFVIDMGGR